MRLRRLDLTRFGKFTDFSIDFGDPVPGSPDLHIVYGLNEAGKSTTFAAFLDLLYGMGETNRYGFRHDYSALEIGARLEIDGATHDLVRIKRRANSLLNAQGEAVNEAILSSALGGIGRDAYRTMFSLDDQSLKDGGNAILQSRGELGELLFSASTGLAGLGRSLVAAADEASEIYRKRASTTRLAELKRSLAALKAERDEIDTFASTYAALSTASAQAKNAYSTAAGELAEVQRRHGELVRILDALPLAGELARVVAELAAFDTQKKPPSEWFALLPQLSRDESRLTALMETAERGIADLRQSLDGIVLDERALSMAERIRSLDDGRARFRTAEEDLPKRQVAMVEQEAALSAVLSSLEQQGHAQPDQLLLPASLTGIIQDLIEMKSGVEAELAGSERELARATANLERFDDAKPTAHGNEEVASSTIARIEAALAKLTASDLPSRLAMEERAAADVRRTFEGHRGRLAPWPGNIDTLQSTPSADSRQIEAWRMQAGKLDSRIEEFRNRLAELVTEQSLLDARIGVLSEAGSADGEEFGRVRKERDAAWRAHLERIDRESARQFESWMLRDDAVSSERVARAAEIAELRQLRSQQAASVAAIRRHEAQITEATAERSSLADRMAGFVPYDMPPSSDPGDILAAAESWAARRAKALESLDELHSVEERARELRSAIDQINKDLSSSLGEAGLDVDGLAPAELSQAAGRLLSDIRERRSGEQNRKLARQELERDLAERRRDREQAAASAESWERKWHEAMARTWFADKAGSIAAVREILKVLGLLPGMLRERDQLAQRIGNMVRDQQRFRAEVAALASELGMNAPDKDALTLAADILERQEEASRGRQRRLDLEAELERRFDERDKLARELAIHEAAKAELTGFFDADTLSSVSEQLEKVRDRERLDMRAAELGAQIARILRADSEEEAAPMLAGIDAGETERQSLELAARIEDLTERTRLLFAEMARAQDRLDAVSGDDAVARIEARRRTTLLEIEDLATRYLKLRAGSLAAERALHAYREKHRSSMMKRASEAFRSITGGNYTGLAARPDKDRETLIALAGDGGSRLASEMSTGTQFQLYLALRLAGYEEFAAVRPPVPFIADDIMESFDNPRSEEVFRLLGEMAKVGQVIYLTHHWHLCEIARSVVPNVRLHQLP